MAATWQATAQAKREAVLALIPAEWKISNLPSNEQQVDVTGKYIQSLLSPEEIEITETDAVGLVQKISSGQWTSLAVTKAFCHRAALAHQLTNCLLEIFFSEALIQAKMLDDYLAEHKKPIGPLHGLPVSLKDQFHVQGQETSMGYVGWIGTFQGQKGTGKERVFESEMVKELRACGAVFYCKTSVPHTLMSGETINNIVGYCWNPKNRNLSAGGSSGGEGALIGLRGSPLGFGTDIGGSIRIPASANGLYGIRPSSGRMPYEGMANSMDGQNSLLSVVGPLATSASSLRLAMKAVLSQEPWLHDPLVVEMPWRDDQEAAIRSLVASSGKLSFAIIRNDGSCTPQPPIRRAMDMLVKMLENLGHQVIDWNPPSHKRLAQVAYAAWRSDGGKDVHSAFQLSGEPVANQVADMYGRNPVAEATASQMAENNVAKRDLQKEYMEYWNSTAKATKTGRPVDAVISPVAPFAAARPEKYAYYGYSSWVNAMDYSSVVVPVTTCDSAIDKKDVGYKPMDAADAIVYESYEPDVYHGAHVSLQLVGRRFQEEKVIALAEYVGEALKQQG